MAIRPMQSEVSDIIPVKSVLISVFDKSGLSELVDGLIEVNPDVLIMSTGGTYTRLKEKLGADSKNLTEVATYTGFPEMEGGLVKTLHPKIHAGILGERNHPAHQEFLANTLNGAVFIDMVVVNLYPFEKVISQAGATFEDARGNIDIGGPTMIRAAGKNFPSVAPVCRPADYSMILSHLRTSGGTTNFDLRFGLAQKVFEDTAKYDSAIRTYLMGQTPAVARADYKFRKV